MTVLAQLMPGVQAWAISHAANDPTPPQGETSSETQRFTSAHVVAAARHAQAEAAFPRAGWLGLESQSYAIMAASMQEPKALLPAGVSQAPSHAQACRARSMACCRDDAQTGDALEASRVQPG
jgi:hypothetical protein